MPSDAPPASVRPVTRTVQLAARPVRLRLEGAYWAALDDIARREEARVEEILSRVDGRRGRTGLAPAVRAFVVGYYRGVAERGAGVLREGPGAGRALAEALDMIGR